MSNKLKDFLRIFTTPAAKISEPEMRLWFSWVRLPFLGLMTGVVVFAVAWARHDSGQAAVMQAADWLARLPLTLATFALASLAWYVQVQVVESLKLGKWAFLWPEDKEEELAVKAAKKLAWGIYLGLSWIACALVFSKALGV